MSPSSSSASPTRSCSTWGEAELEEDGQKVLAQLVGTLVTFKDRTIQIGGHTDSARVVSRELVERYPTN